MVLSAPKGRQNILPPLRGSCTMPMFAGGVPLPVVLSALRASLLVRLRAIFFRVFRMFSRVFALKSRHLSLRKPAKTSRKTRKSEPDVNHKIGKKKSFGINPLALRAIHVNSAKLKALIPKKLAHPAKTPYLCTRKPAPNGREGWQAVATER